MPGKACPHFIIISGSGKKVGKTYLATALIRAFSVTFPLIALKISPHIHDSLGNARLFATLTGMRIFEDLAPHHKNSGQFLEAGALRSFFLETDDEHLPLGFDMFLKEGNPHNYPVICESGALGNLVKPGLLVFIGRSTGDLPLHKATTLHQADLVLPAKTFSTSEVIDRISFRDHGWHYIA